MAPSTRHLDRKRRTLLAGALLVGASPWVGAAGTAAIGMDVWKDPNCGCCKDWIAHVEKHGFAVKVLDQGNTAARARLGMPQRYASCHTALVQRYVIEGHVPAADIQRLLREAPDALGLAVPGMPIGSPGMDGPAYRNRRDPYRVLLVRNDGSASVFSSYA